MLDAKNGHIKLRTFEMDYIRFGKGEKTLVMIPDSILKMYPGLGHGLYENPDFLEQVKRFCS